MTHKHKLPKCEKCGREYCPENSVDERGDWDGSAKQNCSCDLSYVAIGYNPLVEERGKDYGHPSEDFARTAKMWSAILGKEVETWQIPLCMIALKISRECNKQKDDNLDDIEGYTETLRMCYAKGVRS